MSKKILTNKRGFTIIEVVLVLAIAGLIFMMVFVALPALQRSQRDTERNNAISALSTQLVNYQANNRGALPAGIGGVGTKYGTGDGSKNGIEIENGSTATWSKFYKDYLLAGSDVFEDPNGAPYQLEIKDCGAAGNQTGADCADTSQRSSAVFENGYTAGMIGGSTGQNYTILIVRNAGCNGESAVYAKGNRNAAVLYKREGGGTICRAVN